jgi:hypothetical protein
MSNGMMHGISAAMKTGKRVCGKAGKIMRFDNDETLGARRPKPDYPMAALLSQMMGVDTPIPPVMIDARRPEGRPAAGFMTVEENSLIRPGSNHLAPPCLGEALRRGTLVKFPSVNRLSGRRYYPAQFMSVSQRTDMKQQQNGEKKQQNGVPL